METRFCIYGFLQYGELPPCDICPFSVKTLCDTYYAIENATEDGDDNEFCK